MDEKITKTIEINDTELNIIDNIETDAIDYRKRRHNDWQENYALARDKVIINRLTQRQTVNIPLVKYVLNTLLKEMTDPPQLYFSNVDNEQQKELLYNEYWKEVLKTNKLIIRDYIDKKQNAMFGRAYKRLNIEGGKVVISLTDPQDMLISRLVDPADIDSAPDLIECGIWVPLQEVLEEEEYNKPERDRLRMSFEKEDDSEGRMEADEDFQRASEKAERLRMLGVENVLNPVVGQTYIELHQVYRFEKAEDEEDAEIYRYIIAVTSSGKFKLHKARLEDILGETEDHFWRTHYPYTSWASDPEATDWYSDGVVDIVRPINNVLNVWISQLVENRTLQNFSMKYYDSTVKNFVPQTFTPQPWAHLPVPGDPNKIIKDVQTGNLSGTLEELTFLIDMAQKATAATDTTGGDTTADVTLGNIKLALDNAQKRILTQQIFYTEDWKNLGLKFTKLIESAGHLLDDVKIIKKGRMGIKMYKKVIAPKDTQTKSGYSVEIKTVVDKNKEDLEAVQKLQVLRQEMPNNTPMTAIYRHKLMEFSGLTPDEISQIEEFEKQNVATNMGGGDTTQEGGAVDATGAPVPTEDANVESGGIPQVPDIAGAGMQA